MSQVPMSYATRGSRGLLRQRVDQSRLSLQGRLQFPVPLRKWVFRYPARSVLCLGVVPVVYRRVSLMLSPPAEVFAWTPAWRCVANSPECRRIIIKNIRKKQKTVNVVFRSISCGTTDFAGCVQDASGFECQYQAGI